MTIYELIQSQEKNFNEQSVRIVDGYEFSQPDTIRRIFFYQNAKFIDDKGDKEDRVFFDISTPTVRNAAKNVDLDTKDIQFRAVNGKSNYFRSWLYRRKAQQWMRDNKIARKLNSIPEKVSSFGSVVVKKVDDKSVFEFVDLRNLACDPTAVNLNDGWTCERHYYTPNDLRAQIARGWNKDEVERAVKDFLTHRQENFVGDIDTAEKTSAQDQYICVREYYGYVEKGLVSGKEEDTDLVLATFIVILPADGKKSSGASTTGKTSREGLILFKKEISEMPYKELHYRRVAGRWLGKGLYEEMFPMQEVENTRNNWVLAAMQLSQKIILQTRSKTVLQNVLRDVDNGTILKFAPKKLANEPMLERVDTQIKDNASNNLLGATVNRIAQTLTNSYEVTTGENLPSGTPYSLGALLNQNANKLFDFIREDYGLFLEEIFNDWVLPQMERELKKEGFLEIVDKEELDYIRERYTNWRVWDSIKKTLMLGRKPSKADISLVERFVSSQMEKVESLYLEYPADFLSFEKRVVCVVTDESESPAMLQSINNLLQVVAQNPGIIEVPAFEKILDTIGMSKLDFTLPVQSALPQAAGAPPAQPNAVPAPA